MNEMVRKVHAVPHVKADSFIKEHSDHGNYDI
ncbi:hypothetical protein DFP97_10840 [Paenibacillus prosopidis]|uniref:Uncharacterized protein n=1 Tax=Paenibacillus prosopidis TaxID=630520 RepID=A0A368VZI5_9BACL|nr:hypothetical protein DFP97_10840 [Paenibacillus prosopidis]